MSLARDLGQYPTPVWFAERIVEKYFPALDGGDLVLEPSCGAGAFLHALPAHVPAIGVEWDADLAEQARRETGRRIVTGDFRHVSIDVQPTAIIGNPPFKAELIDGFLTRAHELLPAGGRARLPEIYAELEGRRPAGNQWWREKVRQTLRVYSNDFAVVGEGHYQLKEAA